MKRQTCIRSPFFIIITATYNAASIVHYLLESLAAQTCRNFRWIVQDGGSADQTLEIIDYWQENLPSVSLQSSPDQGIYDAWNRALDRLDQLYPQLDQVDGANGQWLLFLGADDALANPYVLEQAKTILEQLPETVLFGAGDLLVLDQQGVVERTFTADCEHGFRLLNRMNMPFGFPALFIRRTAFSKRRFDASYRIAGDYDFLMGVWEKTEQAIPLHICVTHMLLGGFSTSPGEAILLRAEQRRVLRSHFSLRHLNIFLFFLLIGESLLHERKMRFKTFLQSSASGKKIWSLFRKLRRIIVKG